MKKLSLTFGTLLLTLLASSSCKREYVCDCKKTYTGESSSTTQDYAKYTYKDNRVGAEQKCDANERTDSDLMGTYTINCSIED